ncbi:MAG: hypothetical protein R6V62_02755 [Candidatus Fermentibacteraceae bacterium]
MPSEEISGPATITGFAFHRSPSGSRSATVTDAAVFIGLAGGDELGPEFHANRVSPTLVISSERLTVTADDDGMVTFTFDTPWEYEEGDILLELRFQSVSGYLYVFGWTAPGRRYLSSGNLTAERGSVSENMPVVTLITE